MFSHRIVMVPLFLSLLLVNSFSTLSFSQSTALSASAYTYRGDINEDGQVNIFDLLEMLKMLSGAEDGTERETQIADVDASGSIDIFDLLGILKVLNGTKTPGVINWNVPAITNITPSIAGVGDTLNISVKNFDDSTTAAEVKAFINADEVDLLEFGLDSIKIIIPDNFTGGDLKLVVAADTTNSVYIVSAEAIHGLEMVFIPAGTFQMGDNDKGFIGEMPVHTVTLSSFSMSKYEITQGQYYAVTGSKPSYWRGDDHPVEKVNWYDAVIFCNKLSEAAGLESCYNLDNWECDFTKNGFRLPTDAEWEYAARGGKNYEYGTDNGKLSCDNANFFECQTSFSGTVDVGSYPPNPFGLYDMSGNLMEWCNDWYGRYTSESQSNPTGPEHPEYGIYRVQRGGSYYHNALGCRSAYRRNHGPSLLAIHIGFRVVRRQFTYAAI
ncbi:SUMF1/EgtB/PvdO family nonheme iron enzyme [Gemmatimonadota bacterium]